MAEVIGAIGFAWASINLVVSTIENLHNRLRSFQDFDIMLAGYKYQLRSCRISLAVWRRTWALEDNPKQPAHKDYQHIWGIEGSHDICERLELIRNLIETVFKLLMNPETIAQQKDSFGSLTDLNDSHCHRLSAGSRRLWLYPPETRGSPQTKDPLWVAWKAWIRDAKLNTLHQTPINLTETQTRHTLAAVKNALYKNTFIKDRIGTLSTQIQILRDTSEDFYKLQQAHLVLPQANSKFVELNRLEASRNLIEGLSVFTNVLGQQLYEQHDPASSNAEFTQTWALELRLPDPWGHASTIGEVSHVKIDFNVTATKHIDGSGGSRRVRIPYDKYSLPEDNIKLKSAIERLTSSIAAWSPNVPILQGCAMQPPPLGTSVPWSKVIAQAESYSHESTFHSYRRQTLLRLFVERHRTAAALGMANWMILLTQSPWTRNPCTCKIRNILLPTYDSVRAVQVLEASNILSKECACHHTSGMELSPLLAYSVILAEIALIEPLSLNFEQNPEHLRHSERDQEQNIGPELMVQMLEAARPRVPGAFAKVVKFCLQYEKGKKHREHATPFSIEELQLFEREIFQPLLSMYEVTENHKKNQRIFSQQKEHETFADIYTVSTERIEKHFTYTIDHTKVYSGSSSSSQMSPS